MTQETPKTSIVKPASIGLQKFYEPVDNNNIPTPPIAAQALSFLIDLQGKNVWECAVGEGYLAKALEHHGATVVGTDLRDNPGIYGERRKNIDDFLGWRSDTDLIITNPPYGALLRPFMAAVKRFTAQPDCPPIWFLLAQHSMAAGWIHTECGHLLRGYYPFTFGLPYLKDDKWVAGGAFKHAWTCWGPQPEPYKIEKGVVSYPRIGPNCSFITREWMNQFTKTA